MQESLDKKEKCVILVYSEMKWEIVEKDFIGTYPQVMDSKNRIVLPSKYREILNKFYKTNKVYLVPSLYRISEQENFPYIRVLPPQIWQKLTDSTFKQYFLSEQGKSFSRLFWESISEVMDKVGRIVLNQRLIKFGCIEKNIVIAGMKEWFQIWDKNIFDNINVKLASIDLDEFMAKEKLN